MCSRSSSLRRVFSECGSAPMKAFRRARSFSVDPVLAQLRVDVQQIARRDVHDGGLEILHGLDLPLRVAAADGDDGHAHALGPVVQAQAAGEQAVGHHVLEDVGRGGPGPDDAPGEQVRPVVEVVARVVDDRGDARRAAGGVNPQDLVHVHGQQCPLGKLTPQIVLGRERDAPEVVAGS